MKEGDQVSPEMLHRMLAQLSDPVTGQALGRLASFDKAPVAAFDLTFAPKSVSLMWAMADEATRAAVEVVLPQARPRSSRGPRNTSFSPAPVPPVPARSRQGGGRLRWEHYESRDGDPHLHFHGVVLNRAQAVSDGRWRTLDSRALHPWLVALSERHTGLVEDLMTDRFGVAWAETKAVAGRVATREVEGVGPEMVAEFSRRTQAIEEVMASKGRGAQGRKGPGAHQRRARRRPPARPGGRRGGRRPTAHWWR